MMHHRNLVLVFIWCSWTSSSAHGEQWQADGSGAWSVAENWQNNTPPITVNESASFGLDFPSRNAIIAVDIPVTLKAIESVNRFSVRFIGDAISMQSPDESPAVISAADGKLNFGSNMNLISDLHAIVSSMSVLFGDLFHSGSLVKSGPGTLELNGNNQHWNGMLDVLEGTVTVKQPSGLGNVDVGTTVRGGELHVLSKVVESFDLLGGTLFLSDAPKTVNMNGGSIHWNSDRLIDFLDPTSTGGEIQLAADYRFDLQFPGTSVADQSFAIIGSGNNPFEPRSISGAIRIENPDDNNRLLLGGRDAELLVTSNLLAANNIKTVQIVEGTVELHGANDYTGQTIVGENGLLRTMNPSALGAGSGSEPDATIVRKGAKLEVSGRIQNEELIILDAGTIIGQISGNIEVRNSAVISNGRYSGNISGNGDVTFAPDAVRRGTIELNSANSYTGRTIAGGTENQQIVVNHEQAFGDSEQAVLVVGDLNLRALPSNPFEVVDGGRLRLEVPSFEGQITLRNGALVGEGQSVQIQSPVVIDGKESQLAGGGRGRLVVDNRVTGSGDLRVGGTLNDLKGSGAVVFNDVVDIDGDLIIDGTGVEFHSQPQVGGTMILEHSDQGFANSVTFHTDVSIPLLIRGGALMTDSGATVSSSEPILHILRGFIDAKLGNVETIVKSGPWDLSMQNIGPTDAEIVVRGGTLLVESQSSLGTPIGGVVVESSDRAAVQFRGLGNTYRDSIRLNSATGFHRTGGLILGDDTKRGSAGILTGEINAGTGSIIQLRNDAVFDIHGRLMGTDINLIGDGKLRFSGASANFTGRTILSEGNYGRTILSITQDASISQASAIELHRGGTLELDKRQWVPLTDMIADDVPIEMLGGKLSFINDATPFNHPSETIGSVTAVHGDSTIALDHDFIAPSTLTIGGISRRNHATLLFHNERQGTLGGSDVPDPYVLLSDVPELKDAIIGPWAIAANNQRYDFASYGMTNPLGIHALPEDGRPSELNGAAANDHVRLTADPEPLTSDTTIASLVTDVGSFGFVNVDLGGATLDVVSGGILASRTAFHINNGNLTTSGDGSELLIYQTSDELQISGNIIDASKPVSLVKSGERSLRLSGNNTYSGPTVINNGSIVIDRKMAIPDGGDLIINAGGIGSEDPGLIVKVGKVTVREGDVGNIEPDSMTIESGHFARVYGKGTITKTGVGRVTVGRLSDGPFEFRGTIDVESGILALTSNLTGSGPLFVRDGGILELAESRKVSREINLDGGAIHASRSTSARPNLAELPVSVSNVSTILIDEKADFFQADRGIRLNDDATLVKDGMGILRILGAQQHQLQIGKNTTIENFLGTITIDARLVSDSPESSLAFVGPGSDVSPSDISLSLNGDNRAYWGSLSLAQIEVTVRNVYALGNGTTTLSDGGELNLAIAGIRGDVVLAGGALIAAPNYEFIGELTNRSELSPADSVPGNLIVDGDFIQENEGHLSMQIVSPNLVGSVYSQQHDVIAASSEIRFGGTLSVELLNEYSPDTGDRFQLFDAESFTGEFSSIVLSDLGPDQAWSLNRLESGGEIFVIKNVLGDSNRDEVFNSSDLVAVFKAGLYETGLPAIWQTGDWNGDAVFDSGDLVAAFRAGTYSRELTLVPEPGSHLALWLCMMLVMRRWNNSVRSAAQQ